MLLHLFRPIPALSPLAPPRARLQNPQATKQRGTPINSFNHKHDGPHWLIFMVKPARTYPSLWMACTYRSLGGRSGFSSYPLTTQASSRDR